jgi:hypothetical protein
MRITHRLLRTSRERLREARQFVADLLNARRSAPYRALRWLDYFLCWRGTVSEGSVPYSRGQYARRSTCENDPYRNLGELNRVYLLEMLLKKLDVKQQEEHLLRAAYLARVVCRNAK